MTTPAPGTPNGPITIVAVKASSQWSNTYRPEKAFNGTNTNASDCWHTRGGTQLPQWIQATFQAPRRILAYSITTRNTPKYIQPPKAWKLLGYDESTEQWDELDQRNWDGFRGQANMTERFTVNNTSKMYKTVRLFVEQSFSRNTGNPGNLVAIGQLEFEQELATPGPTSPPLPSTEVTLQDGTTAMMTASSQQNPNFSPENLFPSDPEEYKDSNKDWVTGSVRLKNGQTEWVALEFAQPRRVTGYTLISSTYTESFNPAVWMLEGSTDRTNWTPIHSQTTTDASSLEFKDNVNTNVNISKSFTIQSETAYKVVRLVISKSWWDGKPNASRVDLAGWNLQTTTGIPIGTSPPISGGVDVTLQEGTKATMVASSQQDGYPATNLFVTSEKDPDDASKDWVSNAVRLKNNLTEWVVLQFTEQRRVTQYTLVSSAYDPSMNPTAWVLQGSSDGQSWTTIHSQTTTQTEYFKTQAQVRKTFTVDSRAMVTYIRLAISKSWYGPNGNRVDLAEWDLQTSTTPLNETTAPPGSGFTLQDGTKVIDMTSSSYEPAYTSTVKNLFTKDPEEYKDLTKDWVSKAERLKNGQTEWVALQFAQPRRVTQYSLISSAYNPSLNPAAWVLEGSTDGSTWTTLDSHTSDRTGYFKAQTQVSRTYVIQSSAMVTYVRLAISKTWHDDPGQGDNGYRVDLAGWDLRTTTTAPAPTAAPTAPPSVPQVDPTLYIILHADTWYMQGRLHLLTWRDGSPVLEPYRRRDLSQVFLTNSMGFLRNGAGQGAYLKHNEGCLLPMFTMSPGQDAMWQTQATGAYEYEFKITSACGAPLHSTAGSTQVDLSNADQGTSWFIIPVGTATF
jgi:allantoicase